MDLYAIYLRKSRMDLEAEAHGAGETLKRHETTLLALAKERRYHIGEIYREVVSGDTIAGRPEMQRLLADVESGKWRGVLVVEESRLARGDTMDQGRVQQAFYYSHTYIITPNRIFDPDNDADQEYFEFGLFMSRREYKMINRRLNAGRLASAREGKWGGGRCPYGYRKVKLPREKGYTLEVVPEEAQVVRSIVQWYLEGLPVYGIAGNLNAAGILTARGQSWTPPTVYTILDNPVYAGLIRYGYRKVDQRPNGTKTHYHAPEQLGVNLFPGRHEAIITPEEREAIRRKRGVRSSHPGPSHTTLKNPFAGLCYCSDCGRMMVRSLGRHGESRLWCKEYHCTTGTVGVKKVEALLLRTLRERLNELEIPDAKGAADHDTEAALLEKGVESARKELESVRGQQERAFDLVEQGVYTPDVFTERMRTLAAREGALREQLDTLQERLRDLDTAALRRRELIPKIKRVLSLYSTLNSAQEKNELLKEVLSAIILHHPVHTTELSLKIYYLI